MNRRECLQGSAGKQLVTVSSSGRAMLITEDNERIGGRSSLQGWEEGGGELVRSKGQNRSGVGWPFVLGD